MWAWLKILYAICFLLLKAVAIDSYKDIDTKLSGVVLGVSFIRDFSFICLFLLVSFATLPVHLTRFLSPSTCSSLTLPKSSATTHRSIPWGGNSPSVPTSCPVFSASAYTSVATSSPPLTVWLGTTCGGRLWSKGAVCWLIIQSSSPTWTDYRRGRLSKGHSRDTRKQVAVACSVVVDLLCMSMWLIFAIFWCHFCIAYKPWCNFTTVYNNVPYHGVTLLLCLSWHQIM